MPTKTIKIEAESFQWDFVSSQLRYPAFIAGWGTGKTMMALMKGMALSEAYANNLGVIVRSKFTDLRDSTMKDYTKYIKKHVPQGTKESGFSNGSKIDFRHAKDLSGLQNVNLGWFYIEQAEEFPTDAQFQLLRGRLRRILTPKPDVQEQLMGIISDITGLPALREYCDNWENLTKKALTKDGNYIIEIVKGKKYKLNERDIAERALTNQLGIALRQGMVIANANGHNWLWKKWIKSPQKDYMCSQATSFDNIDNLPRDFIDDLAKMETDSPAKFKQYIMNCHDEVDLDACYYISIMNDSRRNDRICHVPYDPSVRVHLSFDIGLDCTSIWFLQIVRGRRNLIDYYENTGKFVAHYVKILDARGYNYGKVILPHDGKSRSKVSGESYAKALRDLKYDVVVNPRIGKDIGINIVADTLPSFYFDEKCKDGLEALDHYRREYDEENRIYKETPLHDWASHPCDSLKEMCQAIKAGLLGSSSTITLGKIKKLQKIYSRTG